MKDLSHGEIKENQKHVFVRTTSHSESENEEKPSVIAAETIIIIIVINVQTSSSSVIYFDLKFHKQLNRVGFHIES